MGKPNEELEKILRDAILHGIGFSQINVLGHLKHLPRARVVKKPISKTAKPLPNPPETSQ